MAGVTAEQVLAARMAAVGAVRIGRDGVASVRMPRLGSVRHGTVEAALRGCPCLSCGRVRDAWDLGDLAAVPAAAAELAPPAEVGLADVRPDQTVVDAGDDETPVPAAHGNPERAEHLVVDLPAALVADLPRGTTAQVGRAARRVVRAHAVEDADYGRLLLMLGLAAEADASTAATAADVAEFDAVVLDEALAAPGAAA